VEPEVKVSTKWGIKSKGFKNPGAIALARY
jgi:hypothetical protein